MDNIITMRSNTLDKGDNERWKPKPQSRDKTKRRSVQLGQGVHQRDGVYWFNNRKIKDLIAFCRRESLIVAPDCNLGPNDR